jgi:DNA-binding winged helix-turn-helix (wHTH) protein
MPADLAVLDRDRDGLQILARDRDYPSLACNRGDVHASHQGARTGDRHPEPHGTSWRLGVALTSLEQSMLYLLAANSGRAMTREEILDTMSDTDYLAESNVVERQIRNLRALLQHDWAEPRFILMVPGRACRFVATVTSPGEATALLSQDFSPTHPTSRYSSRGALRASITRRPVRLVGALPKGWVNHILVTCERREHVRSLNDVRRQEWRAQCRQGTRHVAAEPTRGVMQVTQAVPVLFSASALGWHG